MKKMVILLVLAMRSRSFSVIGTDWEKKEAFHL